MKARVRSARLAAVVSVNRELVKLYWSIGRDVLARQAREGWGAKVIDRLATDLRAEFPEMKGFSPRNLKYMRSFAEAYPDAEFVQQAAAQLTWSHNIKVLDSVRDADARRFYLEQAIEHGWSLNVLANQIDSDVFIRSARQPLWRPATVLVAAMASRLRRPGSRRRAAPSPAGGSWPFGLRSLTRALERPMRSGWAGNRREARTLEVRAQGPQKIDLIGMAGQDLDQPDGGFTRRGGAALVLLERPSSAADQPAGLFLGELQPLADLADVRGVGGLQLLESFVRVGQIGSGVYGVATIIGIPTGRLHHTRH
nr:DUF1016 N-terminal domain-containing protein [uncultured Caulobacter sp.]